MSERRACRATPNPRLSGGPSTDRTGAGTRPLSAHRRIILGNRGFPDQRVRFSAGPTTDDRPLPSRRTLDESGIACGTPPFPRIAAAAGIAVENAISNVVRHARADSVAVTVTVTDHITLDVVDDGIGFDDAVTRRSGLANLEKRAEMNGGCCTATARDGGDRAVVVRTPAMPGIPPSQCRPHPGRTRRGRHLICVSRCAGEYLALDL
ncbi:sensor histidine kinase [Nocardia tengchongensis]